MDPEDPSPVYTAVRSSGMTLPDTKRREAFEEVGLALNHPAIHHITTLAPILTVLPLNAHMRNHIVVTRASSQSSR